MMTFMRGRGGRPGVGRSVSHHCRWGVLGVFSPSSFQRTPHVKGVQYEYILSTS